MAGKKENIKALFTNTRSRVIIVFTAILLIVAIVFGIAQFIRLSNNNTDISSDVPNTPGIQSIPGALNPTAQYAKLQEAQNVNQAAAALHTGGSAIPTIIRSQSLGTGVAPIGSQTGQGGIGFSAILREDEAGQQRSNWILELQNNTCNKQTINKVTAEGAALTDLKEACSCIQLKDNGYQLADLEKVCSCKELKATGVTARQLKDIGYTAGRLRLCGFDACELRNAGFTAQQMKDGGFSDGELKGAGFSDNEIARASGLPAGITEADVLKAGCQPAALAKLKAAGVTASAIRRISGCRVKQLAAAGYTAQELKDAGFTAADLKNAGFTAAQLRQAGFSARDLLNAGFTPADLLNVGYTPADILAAESELPPGITPADIKKAGCDEVALKNERLAGVSAKLIRQYAGCSAAALKAAGFTDADLANAGFTRQQIAAAAGAIKPATDQTIPDSAVKAAGCDPAKLSALFKQGVSAKRIHDLNGCSASALKAAGYDAKALLAAGFTPVQLLAAGFTPEQLNQAGVNPAAIIASGRTDDCSVASLTAARAAGVSATAIRQTLGCNAAAMKAAGYTATELKAAGFTAAELKAAGFTAQELKAAGFTAKELKDAGFTAVELKNAGFTAGELKDAGFTASELKAAGFGAKELKDAGFSAKDLKDAGFSATDLKNAGFSAKDLKEAGFNAKDLKDGGFSAQDLKDAGFSAEQLRLAGYTAKDLLLAGYTSKQLAEAGYSAAELADAGIKSSQVAGLSGPGIAGVSSTMPTIPGYQGNSQISTAEANSAKQLQEIMDRQTQQLADQKYQQQIQQRTSEMLSTANQALQDWKKVDGQAYVEGTPSAPAKAGDGLNVNVNTDYNSSINQINSAQAPGLGSQRVLIKTGDILFAVIDTSVNSDEPSPILATIVSGRFKGAKLIGNFNLPGNADKMVITFNTMSVPGADKSTSINAYAIDADTARTALSSDTNHHYLQRDGALFASSFLQGFGNAIQSANTTVTVGGAAGTGSVTVQNGIGRSTLQNAVIGLATLGQNWAQVAQQTFNRPTTVQVYSGTGVGILFTQDLTTL